MILRKRIYIMSKKLDSIMSRIPAATVSQPNVAPSPLTDNSNFPHPLEKKIEKQVRINAEVPYSVKRQIKQFIANNPGDTEKTVILKGLKLLGFQIEEIYFKDLRAKD
jgi:hypothetical protein